MGTLWNQYHLIKQSITIMFSILVLSCLVLPAVLANDPPCTRCCNLEATVLESTVRLVQCEKDVVDCPEEQNTVTEYLPEYMRCLTKSKKRVDVSVDPDCQYHCHAGHCSTTCGRDGRSLQFILGLLRGNTASPGVGLGVATVTIARGLMMIAMRLMMIAMRLIAMRLIAMRLIAMHLIAMRLIAMRLMKIAISKWSKMRTKNLLYHCIAMK